ncbi:hypothetical protein NQZ68_002283 [Dissostichus eleginoides]|nr:hypothetical protein NQZ68_002283 [Dissostichus eleginoides]
MESDVKYEQTSPTSNTGSGLPCVTVQKKKKRLYIQDLKRILMRSARGVLLLLLLVAVKALDSSFPASAPPPPNPPMGSTYYKK